MQCADGVGHFKLSALVSLDRGQLAPFLTAPHQLSRVLTRVPSELALAPDRERITLCMPGDRSAASATGKQGTCLESGQAEGSLTTVYSLQIDITPLDVLK